MEKKRKTQLALILVVAALTIYNILPTLFFYAQPLKSPISTAEAEKEARLIAQRVDALEEQSVEWLESYCKGLGITPRKVTPAKDNSALLNLDFAKSEEAEIFKKFFPRAGSLISFAPAQLTLVPSENPKAVQVQRKLDFRLENESSFQYIPKYTNESLSVEYQALLQDRAMAVVNAALAPNPLPMDSDLLASLAATVLDFAKFHSTHPELAKRLAAHFSRTIDAAALKEAFAQKRDQLKVAPDEKLEHKLAAAELFLKKHTGLFTHSEFFADAFDDRIELGKNHPFFYAVLLEKEKSAIHLNLHSDVASLLSSDLEIRHLLEQLLVDEAAKIARITNEKVAETSFGYEIPLQEMEKTSGVLTLKLDQIAKKYTANVLSTLKKEWHPAHPDLVGLPILTEAEYAALPLQEKTLCLVVSAPVVEQSALSPALQNQSIYVVAKGINHILRTYENGSKSSQAQAFIKDFQSLSEILNRFGFSGYSGSRWKEFTQDFLFEKRNFYSTLLAATRENFKVYGSKKAALLELSDREQRILTTNKIETEMHEELAKWSDEYLSSSVSLNPATRYDFPKPPRSVFLNNIKLSLAKMVRGDERKIIRWGLDLSGGKTVQLELCDQNNHIVKDENDIKQGINELFNRVNKMGVSDVSIRQMGHHIVLDFPGSQALSANDLVKASSMYFHIVNEKFGPWNQLLADPTDRFLTEVWNEALVSNKKDPDSIQMIAFRHLHGEAPSDAAKVLLENGLKLADPKAAKLERGFDDSLSKVALFRNDEIMESRQAHPLLIVFKASALEGASLDNIRANYDPSKGNFLSFEVRKGTPQEQLHAWTSAFSKETILGTSKEDISQGRGWRMAVLLNDRIISAPTLESALKESASISGSFTQREVNQLASDLKAGSLTFTPRILSEKNVSPELGQADRMKGIGASVAALLLVIGAMIAYYRFAGLVASVAVILNLLILWAVLQNLGASLSLAGIAGIILTVGMAVDANVLVFERIKEEFAQSKRIGTAIKVGYEKAFSAIVDSNVTTIIAALILLNFDAGPIKAFAISMIIGIASSMFTALFITRFYFTGWLKNRKNTALSMANWVKASNYDFLKKAKAAFAFAAIIIIAGGAFLFAKRSSLFGMDFTGGYALPIELASNTTSEEIGSALQRAGAAPNDFHLRKLQSNQYEILLGTAMEQPGKPFYNMPLQVEMKNPRIEWVVDALRQSDIQLSLTSEKGLESNWATMSGQMSESMRNNALLGLLLAFMGIFVYIAFRFEYKYAIAALLCLFHDVLITLGLIGLLHALKVPVQIDLNTIAALMTIIGYSLNDTIIIFDRIREDVRLYPTRPMREIVNLALNTTLSRTAITSGTTLLVLLALLFMGGATMFSFSLVMVIGVLFGTLSSWFIASPLMLFFHAKEEEPTLLKSSR